MIGLQLAGQTRVRLMGSHHRTHAQTRGDGDPELVGIWPGPPTSAEPVVARMDAEPIGIPEYEIPNRVK